MKKKTREKLGIGIKIGAGVLALVMVIGVILQGFMYFQ